MKFLGCVFGILFSGVALAAELREDFSTLTRKASSTAIWNQSLGVVHPTLRAMNFKGGFTPRFIDVSDGSHGAFVPSRYHEFGNIVGQVIYLDTVAYPVLKVTEFLLEDGWRLEPVGANPLIIHSLSDVIVRGEIWCQGHDGSSNVGAVGGVGGEGRCGGRRGGNGGNQGQNGQNGFDSQAPVTGGQGGATAVAPGGGGGGGSWSTVSLPANGPGFAGAAGPPLEPGERGTSADDGEFVDFFGGAGGGGGGGGTTANDGGAGGGGGGGVVVIHAVRDFILGSSTNNMIGYIYANGGNGADPTHSGAPGAGGGGGGVLVLVGRDIRIFTDPGFAAAQAVGGRNPAPIVGAAGGIGRSWFSSVGYFGPGFYDPAESTPLTGPGDVQFHSAPQSVTSTSFDLFNTLAEVVRVTASPASPDFTFEGAGSSDNFSSDDTGWTTDLSTLRGKRYLRFRATITTSNVSDPTMLDEVIITYLPGTREQFDFRASGCGRVEASSNRGGWTAILLLLPFALLIFLRRRA